jgi:RNA polymerase sigma factor (sigma-70 family)
MPESKRALIFNLWQRNHYDELRKFLTVKLKSEEEAADITQEACVRVLSLRVPQDIRQPRAFLFKTALNLVVDTFRQPRRRVPHLPDETVLASLPSSTPNPESIVEARERLTLLQAAIAELPPKCRRVFLLHKFGNLTHKEIAARLGISRNMVEKHIIKAMTHCRKRLDELT